jgi:hypothetical protein
MKGGRLMKNMKKRLFVMLTVVGVIGMAYSLSWGQVAWNDPVQDEFNTADLFLARPASVAVGIIGTGLSCCRYLYDPHGGGRLRRYVH